MFDLIGIKKFILDIIFPIECLGCGKEGEWFCGECQKNKINSDHNSLRGEFLNRAFTFYSYDNEILKRLIHGLKYRYVEDLAQPLGALLVKELRDIKEQIGSPDFIVPVPLYKKRLLERGFNQAELLARNVGDSFGWSVENGIIERLKMTMPQVNLDEAGRRKNISGAFSIIDLQKILNKKIVLMDDVITTGATMEECAKVLKAGGAREVLGVALAGK
jgi:competence protein ComFC